MIMVLKRFLWELCNWWLIHVKHRLYWHGPALTCCLTKFVTTGQNKSRRFWNILGNERWRSGIFRCRGGDIVEIRTLSGRQSSSCPNVDQVCDIGHFTENNYKSQKFKYVSLGLWQSFIAEWILKWIPKKFEMDCTAVTCDFRKLKTITEVRIESATFGSCGLSFIKLRHQSKGPQPLVLIYKREGDLFMCDSKQINKYRYHHEKCSIKRSDVGLLLRFLFSCIFDIQNHVQMQDHSSMFWYIIIWYLFIINNISQKLCRRCSISWWLHRLFNISHPVVALNRLKLGLIFSTQDLL